MYLSTLVTICFVIVLYLHIVFQLKTSNDLEVYEIHMPSKHKLEEVCNFKQPILFDYEEEHIMNCTPDVFKEYNGFDVLVFDEQYKKSLVSFEKANELFSSMYATYHNSDFLNDTMMKRHFSVTDMALRPPMVSDISYDVMMGSPNYTTRLQYSNQYRNYFLVTHGSIKIKLAPPRCKKFLHEIKEYESQEFYSELNPWKDQIKKVKFLEVTIAKGKLLFLPAYWWYSIRLEKDACVCMFHYKTIMNMIATLPDITLGMLQRQNTKTKVLPVLSTPA